MIIKAALAGVFIFLLVYSFLSLFTKNGECIYVSHKGSAAEEATYHGYEYGKHWYKKYGKIYPLPISSSFTECN